MNYANRFSWALLVGAILGVPGRAEATAFTVASGPQCTATATGGVGGTCSTTTSYTDYGVTTSGDAGNTWNTYAYNVTSITAYLYVNGGSPSGTLTACSYDHTSTSGRCTASTYSSGGTITLTSLTSSWGMDNGNDFNEVTVSVTSGTTNGDSITVLGVVIAG